MPDEWHLLWAGPDAPDAYVREFSHRARAAAARLTTPHPRDYMPTGKYTLSSTYNRKCNTQVQFHGGYSCTNIKVLFSEIKIYQIKCLLYSGFC